MSDNNKQEKKMLKVAIVSSREHAQSLADRIKREGHVGFNFPDVSGPIPSSMDVIVCRTRSISHAAYDVCVAEKRAGYRPVVFENGVSKAAEAVSAIAAGTWEEPSLAVLTEETSEDVETELKEALSARQHRRSACQNDILEIIEKGGLFFPLLVQRSPSQARDALESVSRPRKKRVVRGRVYEAFSRLQKYKEATVEQQFEAVLGAYPTSTLWWKEDSATGSVDILLRESLTDKQLGELATGLTRKGRVYLTPMGSRRVALPVTEEPPQLVQTEQVEVVEAEVVEAEEESVNEAVPVVVPVVPVVVPVVVEAALLYEEEEVAVEVAPVEVVGEDEPEQGGDDSTDGIDLMAEKDLRDLLGLLREQMEKMSMRSIETVLLTNAGLRGTVELATIHMSSRSGSACGSDTALLKTRDLETVTCAACKDSEAFALLSWWLSEEEVLDDK